MCNTDCYMLPPFNWNVCCYNDLSIPLPTKYSFFLLKRSLRGGSSVRWHQRSISGGSIRLEALRSSYTANNVTGLRLNNGIVQMSSGEVIPTRFIQQEDHESMGRRSQGRSHGSRLDVWMEVALVPLPSQGMSSLCNILYTASLNTVNCDLLSNIYLFNHLK